ncbi:MAG: LCP family protein [Bacillota bacterium]
MAKASGWEEDTKIYSTARRKKRSRYKNLIWVILAFTAIASAVAVVVAANSLYTFMTGIATEEEVEMPIPGAGERINVLVLGLDGGVNGKYTFGAQRTDTMMLLSLDPEMGSTGILSIPRDTRVQIPGRPAYEKINHAHAYGGAQLAVDTIADFLDVPIHYFVRMDFQGFVEIVDALGGVEMVIERDMVYSDPEQDLYINIKAGQQVLDGKEALQFVRYREYTDADIGRVKAQQRFIDALLAKFFSTRNVLKLPSLASDMSKYIDTNLQSKEILSFVGFVGQIERSGIKMGMIPGKDAVITDGGYTLSYWVADQAETRRIVDELVRGIDREANSGVRVRLLGTPEGQMTMEKVAEHLRGEGYRVSTGIGEAVSKDSTEVVVLNGDTALPKTIARSLRRLDLEPVIYDRRSENAEWDLVITLGKDALLLPGKGA